MSVILRLVLTPVRIPTIKKSLPVAVLTTRLPTIRTVATTFLADVTPLTHFHRPHSSLYKFLIVATGFLLDS